MQKQGPKFPVWGEFVYVGLLAVFLGFLFVPPDWSWYGIPTYVWTIWLGYASTLIGLSVAVFSTIARIKGRRAQEQASKTDDKETQTANP